MFITVILFNLVLEDIFFVVPVIYSINSNNITSSALSLMESMLFFKFLVYRPTGH